MVHHQGYILLRQAIKAASLGKDTADQFMVDFTGALLIRGTRIAVKDLRPQIRPGLTVFDLLRVGEFAPVVGQDDREQTVKGLRTKDPIQCIDDTDDGSRGVGIPQERQHQAGLDEVDGEQAFPPDTPDDAVHLDDGAFRVIRKELLKIRVVPPDPASPVHLELGLLVTRAVLDLAGKVDVPDIKEPGIDIIVQRLLTAHQVVHMVQIDLVQGLPVPHKGTDDPIDPCNVVLV